MTWSVMISWNNKDDFITLEGGLINHYDISGGIFQGVWRCGVKHCYCFSDSGS